MALQFPTNPSLGETYQSGSSYIYAWDGTKWVIQTASPSTSTIVTSASYAPQRQDVTWIAPSSYGGTLFIAGDKLYGIKGNNATNNAYSAAPGVLVSGSLSNNLNIGIRNAYLIDFPNETGSRIVSASANKNTALALFDNGNLYGWGQNQSGELGLGVGTRNVPIFQPAQIATDVVEFYPNDMTSQADDVIGDRILYKKSDGWVWGAGYNGRGGLGLGISASYVSESVRIFGIGQFPMYVANVGGYNGGIVAQKADGILVGCGYNNQGWLGAGNIGAQYSFITLSLWTQYLTNTRVNKVITSTRFFDGSWQDGYGVMTMWISGSTGGQVKHRLYSAGNFYYGAAGQGSSTQVPLPVQANISNIDHVKDVFYAGSPYSLYVWTGSEVYSWGKNDYGQLGYSNYNPTTGAWPSGSLAVTGVVDILHTDFCGYQYGYEGQSPIFKLTDGNYYICGYGRYGQLGIGEDVTTNRITTLRRIKLPISESLKYVGTINTDRSNMSYIGVTEDNRFYGWGRNNGYSTIDPGAVEMFTPILETPQVLYK
jgi:hypothetical protein